MRGVGVIGGQICRGAGGVGGGLLLARGPCVTGFRNET